MSLRRVALFAFVLASVTLFAACLSGHLTPHEVVVYLFTGHGGITCAMALPAGDVTSLNSALADFKEYMDQEKVFDLIWDNNPELTLIAKKDDVEGAYYVNTVKYGGTQGIALGNGYQNALKNQSPELYANFHVPLATLYALGTISNLAIRSSKSKRGAFEDLVQGQMRSAIKDCANEISRAMMASGSASIGQIKSIQVNPPNAPAGSARVTLVNPLSYQFFERNMTVDITATDGSAPLGAPDTATVLQVDAAAGILVFSPPSAGTWAAGSWIVGAFFIRDGNYNANGAGQAISTQQGNAPFSPQAFVGMGAWVPSYAYRQNPGLASAAFLNVDRSQDGTRLAGLGLDQSTVPIDQALIFGAVQAGIYNNDTPPEYVSLNPTSYTALLKILQSQKLYTDVEVSATIAYKFLTIEGGGRPLKVINSRNVPAKTARYWSPGDFTLISAGPCPAPLPYGDMEFLPLPDDDANQIRSGGYLNMVCNNPRGCASVALQE